MTNKVRQMEVAMIDLRAQIDRKVTTLSDELPSRFQTDLRNLE